MNKKKFNYVGLIFLIIMCIGVGLGIYFKFGFNDKRKITASSNMYLTANYEILMYEYATDYVHENIDLESMNVDDEIEVTSDELFKDIEIDSEYEYCSGSFKITKSIEDIIMYRFSSECDNSNEKEINADIIVYENIDGNSEGIHHSFYISNDTKNDYVLEEFDIEKVDTPDGWAKYYGSQINGVRGIVKFDDEYNIDKIMRLDKLETGYIVKTYVTDNYYIIDNYDQEKEITIMKIYDKDLNLVSTYEDYLTNYVTSVGDDIYFGRWGTLLKYNVKTKSIEDTIILDERETAIIDYNDGILYTVSSPQYGTAIYKYDLDGNLISSIEPEQYHQTDYGIRVYANRDYYFVVSQNYHPEMYVFDNEGKLVNEFNLSDKFSFANMISDKEGYSLMAYGNVFENDVNKNYYELFSYDKNHKLLQHRLFDRSKIKQILIDNGFTNEDDYSDGINLKILDGKIIDNFYSESNHGTEIIIRYW